MLHYTFSLYEISELPWGEDEHLCQYRTDSAYEAVCMVLNPEKRLDYITVEYRLRIGELGDCRPQEAWATLSDFESELNDHILAAKVQNNLEVSRDQAAERLIIKAMDNKRLGKPVL